MLWFLVCLYYYRSEKRKKRKFLNLEFLYILFSFHIIIGQTKQKKENTFSLNKNITYQNIRQEWINPDPFRWSTQVVNFLSYIIIGQRKEKKEKEKEK